jgi:hypothetical protein
LVAEYELPPHSNYRRAANIARRIGYETLGKRRKPAAGSIYGNWTLKSGIDEGGNGEVWLAEASSGEEFAVKILKRSDKEAYQRFTNEIGAMKSYEGIAGVLPIVDSKLPKFEAKLDSWYAMPLAVSSMKFLNGMKPEQIVHHFVILAETLAALHDADVSHRDIKPANILALNDRLWLADFGLVKYPDLLGMTGEKRDVGPKFTMAPEMRRTATKADGKAADVYSFAKAIWISLTKKELAFDGQYIADSNLSLSTYFPELYTSSLDKLLTDCTSNDPSLRPTVTQVREILEEWLKTVSDFRLRNQNEWQEFLIRWFPRGAPKTVVWEDLDAIIGVLNDVGNVNGLNHLFFPDEGGNTITMAKRAGEEGFMEFNALGTCLLKPKKLMFESFGAEAHWNYLWLEAEEVALTGECEVRQKDYREYLTELAPGEYCHPDVYEFREDRDEDPPLPKTARHVVRYLKGAFVIFSTSSPYNSDSSTYDARHAKMGEAKFKEYIAKNVIAHAK